MSSQLGVMLRESTESARPRATTFMDLLRDQMDGLDRPRTRRRRWRPRRTLKERLGFKVVGCCGPALGFWPNAAVAIEEDEEEEEDESRDGGANRMAPGADPAWLTPVDAGSGGMNLAAALAAERQYRASREGTPSSASLMRRMEESTAEGLETTSCGGSDSTCCVCMGRRKGAAFIPCGHTYCRNCSRELWLNRGSCPLCNRPIFEILDIY